MCLHKVLMQLIPYLAALIAVGQMTIAIPIKEKAGEQKIVSQSILHPLN
jgi:hypothetical protein